ncbi:acyl-CoA thioesterase-1 [Nitrobacteraceae bacterium AZCC 2146]
MHRLRRLRAVRVWTLRAAGVVFLLVGTVLSCSEAGNAQTRSPAETCLAANENLSLGAALPRTAAVFKSGGQLKIVAIGSSSTVGLWMRDPAKTYPGVLEKELTRLKPAVQIGIINSGRSGDTIAGNMARFESDVFPHKPDIIVWQVGTNDVTWLESVVSLKQKLVTGVRALRASGADVILMDQQYSPIILASQHQKMQKSIASVAQEERVALFPRFSLMRRSVDAGLSIGALVAWDGLHNSAEGYECIGRALARAIYAVAKDR